MSHHHSRTRLTAAMLTVTLTGGTLAAVGVLVPTAARAVNSPSCVMTGVSFNTGDEGTYTVPAGVHLLGVAASGAAAVASDNGTGGAGATVTTALTVTPGQDLDFAIGTSGDAVNGGLSGSSPSGGSQSPYYGYFGYSSGGGGATFVTTNGDVLVAAGGGGGAGDVYAGGDAGPGTITSTVGVFAGGGPQSGIFFGTASGGSDSPGQGSPPGIRFGGGYSGNGQVGGNSADGSGGGGGGGGYQGGGGGAYGYYQPTGGGAGSSFAASPYTIVANRGSGSLTFTVPTDPAFQSDATTTFTEGRSGSFTVCAPGGPGSTVSSVGTLPAGVTLVDNGDGTATLSGTPTEPGTFPLALTAASGGGTEEQLFTLVVNDTAATTFEVTAPATVTAGNLISGTVTAYDAQHDVATTDQDTISLSSDDPHAVLPPVTLVNGFATYTGALTTAGTQTVTATHAGVSGVSNDVIVSPGVGRNLGRQFGDGQTVAAGHDFGSRLTVLVTDAWGNPAEGLPVTFSASAGSSFGGGSSGPVVSGADGLAVSGILTAGATPGNVTVTATAPRQQAIPASTLLPRLPVATSSTTFTLTVGTSDAAAAAVPKSSTGIGTAVQSASVSIPAGGSITLLDSNGASVTTLATADGTYVLDPATGVISFVAVAGFIGTAAPVSYRLTDAYSFQATSTYTPTVTSAAPVDPPPVSGPAGVAHVVNSRHVVLTGKTVTATCSLSLAPISTCRTTLTAHVAGRQIVVGTSGTVTADSGSSHVRTKVRLNALGLAMAAQPGGFTATLSASVTTSDGRVLSARSTLSVVDKHVILPAVLFPTLGSKLRPASAAWLKKVKQRLGAVRTITCLGFTDSVGSAGDNITLGRARATAVCQALARHGMTLVVRTSGAAHPVASNATTSGRQLNRRVQVTLTY